MFQKKFRLKYTKKQTRLKTSVPSTKKTKTCLKEHYPFLKKEHFMCKHKLAVILSSAMGLCKEVQYADETITLMLVGE
ncbi:hypothetical protein TNCT_374122 [Trichonephila clavata]|uniref:Uncharacterized protein n=1 Tax=Trichonephila clavata TaxID=2740835 RepID=A0A8X6LME6_TRICU|nr:hypothetical protein TNCT_374122 [Trichonephila clavata]